MDSGVNIFVVHKRNYLHRFIKKRIAVDLAIEFKGHFKGAGIMAASSSAVPGFLILCYPTFLALDSSCCTATKGAFVKFAGFSWVLINT